MSYADLKPLYPYAGGKARSIKHISKYLKFSDTYIEPFFGGGAVFCHMANLGLARRFIINDIREDLIGIYRAIMKDADKLYGKASKLVDTYNSLSTVGEKEMMFYEVRDESVLAYDPAKTLFVSLSDFGGMQKSDAGGSYGGTSGHNLYAERQIRLEYDQILLWRSALERTTVICGGFQKMPVGEGSCVIFCDPPYYATKIGYGSFTKNDQVRCFNWCVEMSSKPETCVLLSNRDHENFFSRRCSRDVDIINYSIPYSAGENVRSTETLFIWNRTG